MAVDGLRYTYRHDSILNFMSQHITPSENIEVYFDLEGKKINGGTIPSDILVTLSRPDLVIIDLHLMYFCVNSL